MPKSARRVVLALGLCAAFSVLAQAQETKPPLRSVYTDFSIKTCPNDFGRPLKYLADHQAITYRCEGFGGKAVHTTFFGPYVWVYISNTKGLKQPSTGQVFRTGYGVGDKIEWRGRGEGKAFVPEAVILRLQARENSEVVRSALGIARIVNGTVCAVAYIDGRETDANSQARAAADEAIRNDTCPLGRVPRIIGKETELVKEIRDN